VRADLKRLKRDSESSQLAAISIGEVPVPDTRPVPRTTTLGKYVAIAGVLVVALALAMFVSVRRGRAMTEKDTILVTDFVNTTADPVFDGTLKKALAVDLEQSPYLKVFPVMGRSEEHTSELQSR